MINHFRSLLLNTAANDSGTLSPETARSVHIDPDYTKTVLPTDFAAVYNALFPSQVLKDKLLFAHAYMTLIRSVGLTEEITRLDPRVTYPLTSNNAYFSSSLASSGVPTGAARNLDPALTWLKVFNYSLTPGALGNAQSRILQVSQVPNELKITIRDETNQSWLAATDVEHLPSSDPSLSALIPVYDPYINSSPKVFDIRISFPSLDDFVNNTDIGWTIYLASPMSSFLLGRYTALQGIRSQVTSVLAKYNPSQDTSSFDRLWEQHTNPGFKLAGLLVSLVYRMNGIRK